MRRAEVEKLLKEGWELHHVKGKEPYFNLVNPKTNENRDVDIRTGINLLQQRLVEKTKEGFPVDKYR